MSTLAIKPDAKADLPKPQEDYTIGVYRFEWPDSGILAEISRLEDDEKGQLCVFVGDNDNRKLIAQNRFNLMTATSFKDNVKACEDECPEVNWRSALLWVKRLTLERLREGEPVRELGHKPKSMKTEYLLEPIISKGQTTTIFGPGGSGKSYLADYIATLIHCNYPGLADSDCSLMPTSVNVLYLDWEADFEDHEKRIWAIKQGLSVAEKDVFFYRRMHQSLVNDLPAIQRIVSELNIGLVIIDSQMAATSSSLADAAQIASLFYNALRSLQCTVLVLDHVSKQGQSINTTETATPYGSVVKYNRSRSIFELKCSKEKGKPYIEMALHHRKHNEGELINPIGIRINFHRDVEGLAWVEFSPIDVASNPELSNPKDKELWEQIKDLLDDRRALPVSVIARELGKTDGTIRTTLNRGKDTLFRKWDDGTWGNK